MYGKIVRAALIVLLLLVGCTEPNAPQATPLSTLAGQTPSTEGTLAPPPGSPAAGVYALSYYGLILSYDPAGWAPQGDALASRQLATCTLRAQGPTEIPQPIPTPASMTFGPVRYDVYAYTTTEPPVAWYLAREGVAGYDERAMGIPIVVISAPASEWEACRGAAEGLLGSLRVAP